MKYLLLILTLALASCSTTGIPSDLFIGYFDGGVEVTGIGGDITGAGYNTKTKKAYLIYADGTRVDLKIVGAGVSSSKMALYLEGGAKIIIDLKTGKVESGVVPGLEPVLPR